MDAGQIKKRTEKGTAMCGKLNGGGVPFVHTCKKYVFVFFSNSFFIEIARSFKLGSFIELLLVS